MGITRVAKILAIVVLTPALFVAALLAVLWIQHTRPVTLPVPDGPYAVGRADYDWIDRSRVDPIASVAGSPRELTVWIWYPAATAALRTKVDYMPAPLRAALERHMGPILKNFLTHDLARVHCHAVRGAQLSPAEREYPVVLFKPGIGALALDYTMLAEHLASHGYIVAASDSPGSTSVVVYRDGRIAERTPAGHPTESPMPEAARIRALNELVCTWAADERFVLDELQRLNTTTPLFSGRMNPRSAGVFGHSFGGAVALEFCAGDVRCKAGIDVDGRLFDETPAQRSMSKPFLFFLSDHRSEPETEVAAIRQRIDSAVARLPNRPAVLTLLGSRHFNFSDMALTKNTRAARTFRMLGPIDERRALAIAADSIRAFFDTHLKEKPDRVGAMPAKYPEIRVDDSP